MVDGKLRWVPVPWEATDDEPTAEQKAAFAEKYRPPEPRYSSMVEWMREALEREGRA